MTDASNKPSPALVWLRRDLRLADHPALRFAAERGGAVIPVFILDPETEALGAAHLWRLGLSLGDLSGRLRRTGSRLILRRGDALAELRALAAETGAGAVVWSRLCDGASRRRDAEVKAALREDGLEARSFNAGLLFEPWTVETATGGHYGVFTPFWRAVRERPVEDPAPAPEALRAPLAWPRSERFEALALDRRMGRGAGVVLRHATVGEAAASARLARFLDERVGRYRGDRDRLDSDGTSGLSENLAFGEIGPRAIWRAAQERLDGESESDGLLTFMKELVWREFAHHLIFHTPRIETGNWRAAWDAFPWRGDNEDAEAWRRGRTGVPVIDAAMRQLHVTGRMHNRARMLVASYLTKHLTTDWRVGRDWFAECLTDWDPASNALGWQWTAGSGPDASPFFRVFNPETQAAKFDPDGAYRRRWLAEWAGEAAGGEALSFFDGIPRCWGMGPGDPYPAPLTDLKRGRERALAAWRNMRHGQGGAAA